MCTAEVGLRRSGAAVRASVVLVMLALAARVAWAQTPAVAPPSDHGVVCDTGGAIREVVLHYDPDFNYELAPTYRDLFAHLGPHVRIQVLCASPLAVSEFYQRWGVAAGGNGRLLQVIDVGGPLTLWARDRRISRTQRGTGAPIESFVPTRIDHYTEDKLFELGVGPLLRQRGFLQGILPDRVHLEGGNIVTSERRAFVGANVFADNPILAVKPAAFRAQLERMTGLPVVFVGDVPSGVPWIHVDMYLTPLDDDTVLLASPSLACALLADAVPAALLDYEGEPIFHPDAPRETGVAALDAIAARLTAHGLKVLRLPAVIGPYEEWMITYNNVLMDRRDGKRVVLMPEYRVPKLDDAAERIYRELGFAVRRVDVARVYKCGGAIRCLANVTQRDPVAKPTIRASLPTPQGRLSQSRAVR